MKWPENENGRRRADCTLEVMDSSEKSSITSRDSLPDPAMLRYDEFEQIGEDFQKSFGKT